MQRVFENPVDVLHDLDDWCKELMSGESLYNRMEKINYRDIKEWDITRWFQNLFPPKMVTELHGKDADFLYMFVQGRDSKTFRLKFADVGERSLVKSVVPKKMRESSGGDRIFIPGEWIVKLLEKIEAELELMQRDPKFISNGWLLAYVALAGALNCHCQWLVVGVKDLDHAYDPAFPSKFKYALTEIQRLSMKYPVNGPSPARLLQLQDKLKLGLMTCTLVNIPTPQIKRYDVERALQSAEFLKPAAPFVFRSQIAPNTNPALLRAVAFGSVHIITEDDMRTRLDSLMGEKAYECICALAKMMILSMVCSFVEKYYDKVEDRTVTTLSHTLFPMRSGTFPGKRYAFFMRIAQDQWDDARGTVERLRPDINFTLLGDVISYDLFRFMPVRLDERHKLVVSWDTPISMPRWAANDPMTVVVLYDEGKQSGSYSKQAGGRSDRTKKAKKKVRAPGTTTTTTTTTVHVRV